MEMEEKSLLKYDEITQTMSLKIDNYTPTTENIIYSLKESVFEDINNKKNEL